MACSRASSASSGMAGRLLRRVAAAMQVRRASGAHAQQQQQQQLEADRRELLDFLPNVVRDIQDASRVVRIPTETERLAKVVEYNVPKGKLLRSCAALNACRHLVSHRSSHDVKYLAWTFEMLQGAYCIVDDLCDDGRTRRGQPCWHTLPEVGLVAVNDAFLLEAAVYQLLQRHFHAEDNYAQLLQLFCNTTFRSMLGQNHDVHSMSHGAPQFHKFTFKRHATQANFKTSYYTFYAPTAAAMYLAGISDPRSHQVVWDITADIGVLYSAQDDFLDCYASKERLGKCQSDIRNGKCTWLVVEALRRADDTEIAVLKENYGHDDPRKVQQVESLYDHLEIRRAFLDYQRTTLQDLETRIDQQDAVRTPVLQYVLDSVRHHVPQA